MIRLRYNYIPKTNKLGKKKYLMPCYGSRDVFNYYRKDIKKRIPSIYNIDYKAHRDILECYNKKLVDYILNGYDIKIPCLGYMVLRKKFVTVETVINYHDISKLNNYNTFRDGKWKPFIKFKRKYFRLDNLMLYSFKPGGKFATRLHKIFMTKDGHKRYYEL